jgi:plasmid maintenance system antidote protein VapI
MNQRLKEIAEELKKQRKVYTYADLARILDVQRGDLSQMMSGKRPVSKRCVSNLLAAFPELNEGWLLRGEGEMMKKSSTAENGAVSITGEEIKENNIQVNTDETIAKLIAEVAAQRRVTEKVLEQNSELIAIIAGKKKEENQ